MSGFSNMMGDLRFILKLCSEDLGNRRFLSVDFAEFLNFRSRWN